MHAMYIPHALPLRKLDGKLVKLESRWAARNWPARLSTGSIIACSARQQDLQVGVMSELRELAMLKWKSHTHEWIHSSVHRYGHTTKRQSAYYECIALPFVSLVYTSSGSTLHRVQKCHHIPAVRSILVSICWES